MTQDLTTTEQETPRQQLIVAHDNWVVAKFEKQKEIEDDLVALSLYSNKGINTDEESKDASSKIAKLKKIHTALHERRMDATRILNDRVKEYILEETELLKPSMEIIKTVTAKNNFYVSEKDRIAQETKAKIERERNRAVELSMLPAKITNCYRTAMVEELSAIRQAFSMAWARLTIETFEDKMKILKSYNHKVSYDKVLTYFNIEPVHLNPDEVDSAIRTGLDYEKFNEEFREEFHKIKISYLDQIESKRRELQTQSDSQRIQLQQKAEADLIALKAQELFEQKEREKSLVLKEADNRIQQDLLAQAQFNAIKEVKGRTNWEAVIVGDVDWQKAMELYIENGGSLDFMLMFLKKDRPEIEGIEYRSSKTVINRE